MNQDELIKQTAALSENLARLEGTNAAAWKAKRKVEAALAILKNDWPKVAPKAEAKPKA